MKTHRTFGSKESKAAVRPILAAAAVALLLAPACSARKAAEPGAAGSSADAAQSASSEMLSAQVQVQIVNTSLAPEAKLTAEDATLLQQESLVEGGDEEESLAAFVR